MSNVVTDIYEDITNKNIAFLVGSNRSGTTFISKILDSSPSVLYRHEPDFSYYDEALPFLPHKGDYIKLKTKAVEYISALLRQNDPKSVGIPPIFRKEYRSATAHVANKSAIYFAKALAKVKVKTKVPDFIDRYSPQTFAIKSVNSVCRTPLFADAVPSLKVLHIVRHPAAVVASLRRGISLNKMKWNIYLKSLFEMSETAAYPITLEEIQTAHPELQAVFQWAVHNDKIYNELIGSDRYMIVSYEDVCLNLKDRVKDIFEFFGIVIENQTRAFLDRLSGIEGESAGYFSVERNVNSAIDKWKNDLPNEIISDIERIAQLSPVGRFCLERHVQSKVI